MSDRTPSSVRTGTRRGRRGADGQRSGGGRHAGTSRHSRSRPRVAACSGPGTGASAAGAPASRRCSAGPARHRRRSRRAAVLGDGADRGALAAAPCPRARRPADPGPPARGRGRTAKSRGPRRARLQLRHIDTWSALKISLVLSIALFFIWMVAVAVLYGVLSALGVFDTLNDLFGQLGSASGSTGGGGGDVVTPGLVFGERRSSVRSTWC